MNAKKVMPVEKTTRALVSFLACAALVCACLAGCGARTVTTGERNLSQDTNFGSGVIDISQDDFLECGFELGDSVDVTLSNGTTYTDIPFFNGYYTKTGEVLICSYPGEKSLKLDETQGSIWEKIGATQDTKITVTLHEKGKYMAVQAAFDIVYSNNRQDYDSDEQFANFRVMKGGSLKQNLFYRSASPVDNTYNRAPYACALANAAQVRYVLNLSDNQSEYTANIDESGESCTYYKDLYEAGCVDLMNLSADFRSSVYKETVAASLLRMCDFEGPYLFHCVEGKDRTGFVCMLVEALAGASLDEIVDDYMKTYECYYGVTQESDKETYDIVLEVKALDMLSQFTGVDDATTLTSQELRESAERYLQEGGLSAEQVEKIKSTIIS